MIVYHVGDFGFPSGGRREYASDEESDRYRQPRRKRTPEEAVAAGKEANARRSRQYRARKKAKKGG